MVSGWLTDAHTAVCAGLTAQLSGLAGGELVALARGVEVLRRQLAAVEVQVTAELDTRAVAGEFARSSTADLLVSELLVSPAESKARVARAADLAPRRALSGEPLPALLPVVAAALSEGQISIEHVRVITDCLEQLPCSFDVSAVGAVEAALVHAAQHENPATLRRTAAMLLARADPDGIEPREDEIHRRRDLTLARNRDGSGRLTGRLTVEAVAVWDTILDSLSAPLPSDDGEPDQRTAGQRRHDGLVDAGHRLLRSADLPAAGGVPVTVLLRTTAVEVDAGVGVAQTSRGDLLSVRDLAAMSSDAELMPVMTNPEGAVLSLGRTRRLASRAQRLALASRDGGCSFPDCSRPAAWTEVHHVRPWQDGGATDLSNMCLVCRYHHRDFEARGWQVRMADGLPEWTPPVWLDPAQRPRRNTAHHPPDITFDLERARVRAA